MDTRRVIRLLPLLGLLAVATAGAAAPQDRPADGLDVLPASQREGEAEPRRECPHPTGTRIVRKQQRDGDCVAGVGRSYGRRDIASTGATDAARALDLLDPSIRTR